MNRLPVIFFLLLAGRVLGGDSIPEITLRQHLEWLAADAMEGRWAGGEQNHRATLYIDSCFRAYGLQPLGSSLLDSIVKKNDESFPSCNVIGFLPGRSRPSEYLVISAHFDHVPPTGSGRTRRIYNGANDNASGTAALLALAAWYARQGAERSILFCAFNREELGLVGSTAFSSRISTDSIVAMINLEMLGIAQYGKGKLFITGENYSSFGTILRKAAMGSSVRFIKERGVGLFSRSDNYPFAQKGVPAHSLMSSSDSWPCYHRPCDTPGRIRFDHLALVTNGIVQAIHTLVDGTETPTRIR